MIQQGHKYSAPGFDNPVIAVAPAGSGAWIVREIDGEWLGASHMVYPECMTPMPMKYFGGEVPSADKA